MAIMQQTPMGTMIRSMVVASALGSVLIVDQFSKAVVRAFPDLWDGAIFFVDRHWTTNSGIAFGIPFPMFLYVPMVVVLMTAMLFLLLRAIGSGAWMTGVSIAAVMIGGLSNGVDRLMFGGVTDIFLLAGQLSFNVADLLIIGGVGGWILRRSYAPRRF